MHFVRNKNVVEEVLASVTFVREIAALNLFPMQVVRVREQMCVETFAAKFLY